MTHVLIRGAHTILTMDDSGGFGRVLHGQDIRLRAGVIAEIGPDLPLTGAEPVVATDAVVTPGLINTHHHLFQTLTRAVPGAQNALLFGWLQRLYPIWARFGPDEMRISATIGLAELALSGCSTSSDHLYLYPNGARLDDTIEAAREIGLRFHPTRGAMSIGQSLGGLPPDTLVEREADILNDTIRVIDRFHDPRPGAMCRVGVAPCSPFSVSRGLMRDAALLARDKGVRLHTHLAENDEDIAWSLSQFGCRPGQYAEDLAWTGDDVWHAHCVKLDAREIALFARSGTGVAHCPSSNMRLGSGIARVREMMDLGIRVGIGVDGSASNDASDMLGEARNAMLLQRVKYGASALTARETLKLAIQGGAELLGFDRIGRIEPGYGADLALFDMKQFQYAGSLSDPVAAILFTGFSHETAYTIVNGRVVVRNGNLEGIDENEIACNVNRIAATLINP